MSSPLVILILSLLLGLQPITTDLYLPALPALTASFGAVPAQAQLTLTALLLAFGASQLFWGPLSDRVGRRRVLLIGLAGYTLAAVGSALAGSIEVMVFWRVLQGAFMGAGTVCARAIVRDRYRAEDAARMMALLKSVNHWCSSAAPSEKVVLPKRQSPGKYKEPDYPYKYVPAVF